ncbi:hypothetical protein HGM15179_005510, partial [Zosterops borbonicus]
YYHTFCELHVSRSPLAEVKQGSSHLEVKEVKYVSMSISITSLEQKEPQDFQ